MGSRRRILLLRRAFAILARDRGRLQATLARCQRPATLQRTATHGRWLTREARTAWTSSILVIQIPSYNEAATLPGKQATVPRDLLGLERIAWIVADDGSTDGRADVARQLGVAEAVRLSRNHGRARALFVGLEAALAQGADVIVNTDADNQYDAADIARLLECIARGEAQMVVGERPIAELAHFSTLKKLLQRLGSGGAEA